MIDLWRMRSLEIRKKPESDFCKWNDNLINYVKTINSPSVFENGQYKPTEERPLVYHINGDIAIPGSMVLTERDYFEFIAYLNKNDDKDILPSILRTEISTSSLLFIHTLRRHQFSFNISRNSKFYEFY